MNKWFNVEIADGGYIIEMWAPGNDNPARAVATKPAKVVKVLKAFLNNGEPMVEDEPVELQVGE